MSAYLPGALRARIAEADRHRCCYCLTTEANSGIPLAHDHIQPLSKGGATTFENVCLAPPSSPPGIAGPVSVGTRQPSKREGGQKLSRTKRDLR